MERGQPDIVGLTGALSTEELLTAVQPVQRVVLAVEHGNGELVVTGNGVAFVVVVVLSMRQWRGCLKRKRGRRVGERDGVNWQRPIGRRDVDNGGGG